MTEGREDDPRDDIDEAEQVWDLGLQNLFDEAEETPSVEPAPGDHCGRYRLVEEIAQGGMGRVFRAQDERLDRAVAVKILRERLRRDDLMTARFVEEARIAAQLQHPGIVPVYDVGLDSKDRPWFSMKLVEGRTLTELLAERRAPDDELARFLGIFAVVCQAVGYAHTRGVIHRDLKPSNVMVGSFGEVQVLDWGFAKVLRALQRSRTAAETDAESPRSDAPLVGSDSSRSVSGSVLGTPRYMSPEQARGEIENLDQRTDVFALGGMLCEILSDQPPWGRRIEEDPVHRAARGDLSLADEALRGCEADHELIELCRRCLTVDPAGRPASAGDVAGELTHYLAEAEERTRLARVETEAALASAEHERRTRYLTVALGLIVVAIVAGALWFVWQRDVDRREDFSRRREQLRAAVADAHDFGLRAEWALAVEALERGGLALGDDAPPSLRRELERALVELEARSRRHEVLEAERQRLREFEARLDQIRLTSVDEPGAGGEDYEACFAGFGCDVIASSPEIAYLELVKLPTSTQETIRPALDDWASRERALEARRPGGPDSGARSTRLLELAQFLDADPWRRRLRAAVIDGDEGELARMADEAREVGIAPNDAVLLATTLQRSGEVETAVSVLRISWLRHPGDAWLNHHIALFLRQGPRDPARRQEDAELALRHAHLAMALSPESTFLREQVIELSLDLGRRTEALALIDAWRDEIDDRRITRIAFRLKHDDAVVLFQSALVGRPESLVLHRALIEEHLRTGDFAVAERCARAALEQVDDVQPINSSLVELLLDSGRLQEASDLLADAELDENSRHLHARVQRWQRMMVEGTPIDLPSRRERARLLGLRGDDEAAIREWLVVLRAADSQGRPGRERGRRPGPGGGPGGGRRLGPGGEGLGPGPGPGGRAGGRGRGPGPPRRESPLRPARQDALAAVLSFAAGNPERAAELAGVAAATLEELAARNSQENGSISSEIESIAEDRRIPRDLEVLARVLGPEALGRLDQAWAALQALDRGRSESPGDAPARR